MKKMAGAGQNYYLQLLWLRPGEHCGQRHYLILVAVNDQCIGRNSADIEASHCRRNQHQPLRGQAFYHA